MTTGAKSVSVAMLIACFTASAALCAAEEVQHPCANVRDDTDRLACYDQAFGKPADRVASTPQDNFGFKDKEAGLKSGKSAGPEAQGSVTAAITSLDRRRDGKFVVTLDNAQVWSQSEINSQVDVQVGDAITVRRGALGSYLLVTKAGIATRVRRVK